MTEIEHKETEKESKKDILASWLSKQKEQTIEIKKEEPVAANTKPIYMPPRCYECNEDIAFYIEEICDMTQENHVFCEYIVTKIREKGIYDTMNEIKELLNRVYNEKNGQDIIKHLDKRITGMLNKIKKEI